MDTKPHKSMDSSLLTDDGAKESYNQGYFDTRNDIVDTFSTTLDHVSIKITLTKYKLMSQEFDNRTPILFHIIIQAPANRSSRSKLLTHRPKLNDLCSKVVETLQSDVRKQLSDPVSGIRMMYEAKEDVDFRILLNTFEEVPESLTIRDFVMKDYFFILEARMELRISGVKTKSNYKLSDEKESEHMSSDDAFNDITVVQIYPSQYLYEVATVIAEKASKVVRQPFMPSYVSLSKITRQEVSLYERISFLKLKNDELLFFRQSSESNTLEEDKNDTCVMTLEILEGEYEEESSQGKKSKKKRKKNRGFEIKVNKENGRVLDAKFLIINHISKAFRMNSIDIFYGEVLLDDPSKLLKEHDITDGCVVHYQLVD